MPSAKHLNRYRFVDQATSAGAPSRGRPRGKPKPLTQEQRRDRNAQLERGRRDTMADAYEFLRTTLGHGGTMTRAETLTSARNFILRDRSGPSASDLRRQNKCLMQQIDTLKKRLCVSSETDEDEESEYSLQSHLASEPQLSKSKWPHSATQSLGGTTENHHNYCEESQTTDSDVTDNYAEFYPSTQPNNLESRYERKRKAIKIEKRCKSDSGQTTTQTSNSDVPIFSTQFYNGLHAIVPEIQVKSEYDDSSYTIKDTKIVPEHNPMLSATSCCDVKPFAYELFDEQTGICSEESQSMDDNSQSPSYYDVTTHVNEYYKLTRAYSGESQAVDDISESTSSYGDVKPLANEMYYEQAEAYSEESQTMDYISESPSSRYQHFDGSLTPVSEPSPLHFQV